MSKFHRSYICVRKTVAIGGYNLHIIRIYIYAHKNRPFVYMRPHCPYMRKVCESYSQNVKWPTNLIFMSQDFRASFSHFSSLTHYTLTLPRESYCILLICVRRPLDLGSLVCIPYFYIIPFKPISSTFPPPQPAPSPPTIPPPLPQIHPLPTRPPRFVLLALNFKEGLHKLGTSTN